jgi:hypothetical protein
MGVGNMFRESTLAKYARTIKESPREVIFNGKLLFTAALYAMAGICISKCITPSLMS